MVTSAQLMVIFGLLMVMAELFVGIQTGFDLVAIGSVLTLGGLVGLSTGNVTLMLVSAATLAFIYILFGRKYIKNKLIITTRKTNIDSLIDQTGVIVRSVTPDTAGLVRLKDEDWRAVSAEVLYEKDRVKVKAVEGVSLVVEKL